VCLLELNTSISQLVSSLKIRPSFNQKAQRNRGTTTSFLLSFPENEKLTTATTLDTTFRTAA